MDIKQDPNAIPNFNSGGRLGEAQRNEPEQVQSSVELDPTAGGDGAASEAAEQVPPPSSERERAKPGSDRSAEGAGGVDGHVGAP